MAKISIPKLIRKFFLKCRTLFPINRRFANYKQLDEFVTFFLNSWKIRKQRAGMTFKYFNTEDYEKKAVESLKFSIKDIVECPFVICFSIPGIKKTSTTNILFGKDFHTLILYTYSTYHLNHIMLRNGSLLV